MAVTKTADTKTFSIEVKTGVNAKGEDTFGKKSFDNVKIDAEPQNIYDVAEAIKSVLAQPTRAYFMNTRSILEEA